MDGILFLIGLVIVGISWVVLKDSKHEYAIKLGITAALAIEYLIFWALGH